MKEMIGKHHGSRVAQNNITRYLKQHKVKKIRICYEIIKIYGGECFDKN